MKISIAAIHEAAHCIVAIGEGLIIKETRINGEGNTEVAYITVHPERRVKIPFDQITRLIQERSDLLPYLSQIVSRIGEKTNKLVNVSLAGWAAEEVFAQIAQYDMVSMVHRAKKDLEAICNILGVQEYKEILIPYIISEVFSRAYLRSLQFWAPVIKIVQEEVMRGLGYDNLPPAPPRLRFVVEEILDRKNRLKRKYFITRQERVVLKTLANELLKKKRLSGSEVVGILEKARKSWKFRWNGFLDGLGRFFSALVESVQSIYKKV